MGSVYDLAVCSINQIDIAISVAREDKHLVVFVEETNRGRPGVAFQLCAVDNFTRCAVNGYELSVLSVDIGYAVGEYEVFAIPFAQ
jgi:hypothetical protein